MSTVVERIIRIMKQNVWDKKDCKEFINFTTNNKNKNKNSDKNFKKKNTNFYVYISDIFQWCDMDLIEDAIDEPWFKFNINCFNSSGFDSKGSKSKKENEAILFLLLKNYNKVKQSSCLEFNEWWENLNESLDIEVLTLRGELTIGLFDVELYMFEDEDVREIILAYTGKRAHLLPKLYYDECDDEDN